MVGERSGWNETPGKSFKFKNFAQALEFTNKIGAIAQEENYHPLIITE